MTDEEIFAAMTAEDQYQNQKAVLKGWNQNKSLAEWLIIMEAELEEAKRSYCKNGAGRDKLEHEILQVMTVGMNALRTCPSELTHHLIWLSTDRDFSREMFGEEN